MAVKVQCQACGASFLTGDEMHGRSVNCSNCQRPVSVPGAEAGLLTNTGSPGDKPIAPPSSDIFAPDPDSIFVNPERVSEDVFGRNEEFNPGLNAPGGSAGQAPAAASGSKTMMLPPNAPPALSREAARVDPPAPERLENGSAAPHAPAAPMFTEVMAAPPWSEAPPPAAPEPHWMHDESAPEPSGEHGAIPIAPRPRPKLPASFWVLSVLVPYTIAMTVFAVLLYLRPQSRSQHPLESLIDQGGYEEGKPERIEDPNRDLPGDLKPLRLHEARTFNDLEVTPLAVARERVRFQYQAGRRDQLSGEEMLVLRLRLKNVSHPPVIFRPNDPAFVRGGDMSYSYLQIGKRRFYSPLANVLTDRIQGQNFDELLPDASMETIVVAGQESGSSPETAVAALKKVSPTESIIWRVHLRKGREKIEAKGRSKVLWVTTVVPVTFTPNDIKQAAAPN